MWYNWVYATDFFKNLKMKEDTWGMKLWNMVSALNHRGNRAPDMLLILMQRFWADFIDSDMQNWASFMNKMCGICQYLFGFKEHSFNVSIVYSENVSKLRFLTKSLTVYSQLYTLRTGSL